MFNLSLRALILLGCLGIPAISWSENYKLQVKIEGLPKEAKQRVLNQLSLSVAAKNKDLTPQNLPAFYQQSLEEMSTALQALGYYHANLQSSLKTYPKKAIASYFIRLGSPILIQTVDLQLEGTGAEDAELKSLLQTAPLKNTVLNQIDYEAFKEKLLAKALQLGYLDAVFEKTQINLDVAHHKADIFIKLKTYQRYKFGKITFDSSLYPDDFLTHYIPFKKESPYTTEHLLALQKTLMESDLFSKVRLWPDISKAEHLKVPLKIILTPKPRHHYLASLGFSTNYGPRALLGWELKRTSNPGHRVNVQARTSKRLNQLRGQYSFPGKEPITDRYILSTQLTEERPSDKKHSSRNETGITYAQKRGQLEQLLGVQYLSEVFKELPTATKKQSHFILPKLGYIWSTLDHPTLPKEGMRVSFSTLGALGLFLSTTNLIQGQVGAKWIKALGEKTRLLLRSELGAIAASRSDEIPLSLRFYTGGDSTVRGYGFNSLGPQESDANGKKVVVGGRYLFIGSLELERTLYKNVGVATFFDMGNAMNRFNTPLAKGAGLGLRYQTPLGPLRLDVARPLLKGKHHPRIHLTFGADL